MSKRRSISVYAAPIVLENGYCRFPTWSERETVHNAGQKWKHWGYEVKRVSGALTPRPGTSITEDHLNQLDRDGWHVTVLRKPGQHYDHD